MSRYISKDNLPMFLVGCFSMTQVNFIGSIGISEFFLLAAGPLFFFSDYQLLQRDGFLPIVWLSILCCVGCLLGSVANHTPLPLLLRGLATPSVVFCALVVGHRYLRRSPGSFVWFFLGVAISWTINIFVFQRGVDSAIWAGGAKGLEATEGIMGSPTFWISRVKIWMNIPIQFAYLKTPFLYSFLTPVFLFFFSALTSESGRSAALSAIGAAAMVYLGGKKRLKMRRFSRIVIWVLLAAMVGISLMNKAYKHAAASGALGEKAQVKFQNQMKGDMKAGVLTTLMRGRMEFFVGAYACLQRPLLGYGPWAMDEHGYYEEFLTKYGSYEDYEGYMKFKLTFERGHGVSYITPIPAHSHIMGFWLWYGIFGLLFWLYVLAQIFRYFKRDLATVPQWYGIIAVGVPSLLWNMFFSPFGDRVPTAMVMVGLMMTRAIRMGRVRMPFQMQKEVWDSERR